MATNKLAELRAKLQQAEEAKQGKTKSNGDGLTYPFWDAESGTTATLRFLPDGNPDNTYFWRERQVIKLTFPGIKGYEEDKPVTIQVPCVEMWGDKCPILQEIRPWFKGDADQEELARKYWKKRTYMFQGFVRDSSLDEGENAPENPIRKFIIGPQIFEPIKNSLLDPEFESMPTDYVNGTDFKLVKGVKGKYADYSSSAWARKESSLTEEEAEAIDQYGLVDLETYLPERPNAEALAVIFEMFEASVDGELYDPERWADYYKPYGFDATSSTRKESSSAEEAKETVPQEAQEEAQESAPTASSTPASAGSASAKDILAKIKGNA